MNKICRKCKIEKPATKDNFYFRKDTEKANGDCKSCQKLPEAKTRRNQWAKDCRMSALIAYSGKYPECKCCGERELKFLGIDHINGGGNKHRQELKTITIYMWLKKNNYPEGFQVLCHNCNLAKGYYGECPHNIIKT